MKNLEPPDPHWKGSDTPLVLTFKIREDVGDTERHGNEDQLQRRHKEQRKIIQGTWDSEKRKMKMKMPSSVSAMKGRRTGDLGITKAKHSLKTKGQLIIHNRWH